MPVGWARRPVSVLHLDSQLRLAEEWVLRSQPVREPSCWWVVASGRLGAPLVLGKVGLDWKRQLVCPLLAVSGQLEVPRRMPIAMQSASGTTGLGIRCAKLLFGMLAVYGTPLPVQLDSI